MAIRWQSPDVPRQVLAAVLLVALGIAIRFAALGAGETRLPYVTFYPPVILAALYGGLFCGLVATSLLVIFTLWWVAVPQGQFAAASTLDVLGVVLFAASCATISAVSHALHRARARTAVAEAEMHVAKEREAAAQRVRASEDFERQIINSIAEGLIVLDRNLQYRVWNRFMEQASGIPADQVIGKRPEELFPWMRERGLMQNLEKALRGETVIQSDVLTQSPSGRQMWVAGRTAPLQTAHGEVIGVIATVQDIHERKLAEQQLQDMQERLQLALGASHAGLFEWNPDSGEISWSPELYAIYGFNAAEGPLTFEQLRKRIHPEDLEATNRILRAALEQPEKEYRAEFRIRHPQYGERWVLATGKVERDAQGKPLRLAGLNIDITERKRTESVLLEATRRSKCILNAGEVVGEEDWQEHADDPEHRGFRWDLVVINEAAAQEILPLEIPPGETYQSAFARCRDNETSRAAHVTAARALVAEERSFSNFYRCIDRYGRVHWLHQTVSVEPMGWGRWRAFGVSTDITELKRTEAELAEARRTAEEAREAAEQANRAKDHFLAVLSHELRTPLTAVIPALDRLLSQLSGQDAAYLEMARRNVELEARLIDDLLDVTRIARGKIELDRHVVDMCSVLQHATEVCRPDIEARQLHMAMHAEPGICFVNGDASRLQQVFWNLLKNAVKFTPTGGCVAVRCGPDGEDKRAIIEVSDSGEGIEPESLSRIFNAFEQEAKATTRQFGGLGLGLAISKALVELHGGEIRAKSDGKGRGATFVVELPLAVRSAIGPQEPAVFDQAKQVARTVPRRILLVEDHGDTARILAQLLREAGHQVHHAADVATAIQVLAHTPIDLLLSDLGLPDGTGHELMRSLRSRGITIPGIALSGYGMASDVEQSHAAGYAEHLTKPISFGSLQAAVARVCSLASSLAS